MIIESAIYINEMHEIVTKMNDILYDFGVE